MDPCFADAPVRVLDKSGRIIFKGCPERAIEWIIENPLRPHMILVEILLEVFTIDDYLEEWDRLMDE